MTESELQYIIARILENAVEAANEARATPEDEFARGRRLAYYEVLDTVKNELSCRVDDLKAFGLHLDLEKLLL